MHLASSVMRSEPAGTLYSNSIVRLDIPFVVADQPQHFRDRRVAFAEGRVGSVVELPVLHMHMRDPVVILLEERHRRSVVARHEMPEIHIRAVEFRERKSRLPMLGLRRGVAVVARP